VYDDNVSLFAQYPLSTNRRLEFSAGATRYSYSTAEIVDTTDPTGDTLYNEISPPGIPSHGPQNFFSVSAAYIGDYSNYGFTGPVSGKAYHFEITPTTGSLTYTQIIADYRYYWFLRPFTIAFRALHVGLYGGGADSIPFSYFYLGDPTLVRGYWIYPSASADSAGATSQIQQFNRLIGSKIAVGNVEARFSLFGTRQFGLIDFRYLPTDLIAFCDGGVAWTNRQNPVLRWSTVWNADLPLFSVGFGARFNLFGALIFEADAVHPFQLSLPRGKGLVFSWALSPGW
jgi:outer membrane protein assembly factor BamA